MEEKKKPEKGEDKLKKQHEHNNHGHKVPHDTHKPKETKQSHDDNIGAMLMAGEKAKKKALHDSHKHERPHPSVGMAH